MSGGVIAFLTSFVAALVIVIYYEYADSYRRERKWRRENQSYTVTTDTVPTTWVLEAQFRELSEAEIKQIFTETTGFDFDDNPGDSMDLMGFAQAVIRRAQER